MKLLSDLLPGQSGSVAAFEAASNIDQRIIELGVQLGSLVSVRRRAPFGDPIVIQFNGGEFVLRRAEAANIAIHEA